jgi:hypothetical protein
MVGSNTTTYPFKIWLDILDVPPHLWSLDELIKGLTNISMLVDHAPLPNIQSFERFRILIAATHMRILKSINFLLQGVQTVCNIEITSWLHDEIVFDTPPYTSPSEDYYVAQGIHMLEHYKFEKKRLIFRLLHWPQQGHLEPHRAGNNEPPPHTTPPLSRLRLLIGAI